jgi:hypothetical protein
LPWFSRGKVSELFHGREIPQYRVVDLEQLRVSTTTDFPLRSPSTISLATACSKPRDID